MEAISKKEPIPETFNTLEEAAEFWDTHDTADYEEYLKEVKDVEINIKTITREVQFEPEVALQVARLAKVKGTSFSVLVNSWIKEKLNIFR